MSLGLSQNRITCLLLAFWLFLALCSGLWAQEAPKLDIQPKDVEQRRIIALLQQQRQGLKEREVELKQRQKELKILRQEVEEKVVRLKEAQEALKGLLEQARRIENERLGDLSGIYERMDPQRAAAALQSMDQDLAIGILSRMRSKGAGEILNELPKEKAAKLSKAFSRFDLGSD